MHEDVQDQAPQGLELRVLHGPQAGSRLELQIGAPYLLGTGETCEVLLAGVQVEPEHALLTVAAEGIFLEERQGRVGMDTYTSPGTPAPFGTVVQLGRVKLTVDWSHAPWPGDEVLDSAPRVQPHAEPAGQDAPATPRLPAAPRTQGTRASAGRAAASRPLALLILAAVGVAGLLATLIIRTSFSSEADAATPEMEPLAALAPVHDGPGPAAWSAPAPGPGMEPAAAGPELAPGAAQPTPAAPAPAPAPAPALAPAVSEPAPPPRRLTESERVAAAARFVQESQRPGSVELRSSLRDDVLHIEGAAESAAAVATIRQQAQAVLGDGGAVQVTLVTRQELREIFAQRLQATSLTQRFEQVQSDLQQLTLQGVLSAADVRAWETLFADFTREFGTVLQIRAQVQTEGEQLAASISAVVGGAAPYIVTLDGRRVGPGGQLQGRTVTLVRDGEIVFADGLKVRYGP